MVLFYGTQRPSLQVGEGKGATTTVSFLHCTTDLHRAYEMATTQPGQSTSTLFVLVPQHNHTTIRSFAMHLPAEACSAPNDWLVPAVRHWTLLHEFLPGAHPFLRHHCPQRAWLKNKKLVLKIVHTGATNKFAKLVEYAGHNETQPLDPEQCAHLHVYILQSEDK